MKTDVGKNGGAPDASSRDPIGPMAVRPFGKYFLVRKLADLEESVARERQRANETDLGRVAFPSFLKAMDSRRENLKATLKEIERERAQTNAESLVACQELKSVELAAEQEARRAAEAPLERSRMRLGEIALARQLRKQALRQI